MLGHYFGISRERNFENQTWRQRNLGIWICLEQVLALGLQTKVNPIEIE
jgi:hypothetical protein